jgi:N-acetylneuraminic acid mutarotase
MKKLFLILLLLLSIIPEIAFGGAAWTVGNFPSARFGSCGFSIGADGYIVGGSPNGGKEFWNITTNQQKTDFPGTTRILISCFAIAGKGYAGVGESEGVAKKDFYEYSPLNNTWTQKADFPGLARFGAVGFALDGKGYIGIGSAGEEDFVDFYEYNPINNTWTQKADFLGLNTYQPAVFTIDNIAYVGTGEYYTFNGETETWEATQTKELWKYSPLSNTWVQLSSFTGQERHAAVGMSMNGKGYIFLGSSTDSSLYEYNPISNGWAVSGEFPIPGLRAAAVGFSIETDDTGYVGGGANGGTSYNNAYILSISHSLSNLGQHAGVLSNPGQHAGVLSNPGVH